MLQNHIGPPSKPYWTPIGLSSNEQLKHSLKYICVSRNVWNQIMVEFSFLCEPLLF